MYYGKFGKEVDMQQTTFFYNFSNKWLSDDGMKSILIFSGVKSNDSWNMVSGHFTLRSPVSSEFE